METLSAILGVLLILSIALNVRSIKSIINWKEICNIKDKTIGFQKDSIESQGKTIGFYKTIVEHKDATIKSYDKMLANGITGLVTNKGYKSN